MLNTTIIYNKNTIFTMNEKEKLREEIHKATQYCLENRLVSPKMQIEAHKNKERSTEDDGSLHGGVSEAQGTGQSEGRVEGNIILYHKAEDGAESGVSERDAAVRDAIVDIMRGAGIEVVTDTEEAQKVLDLANGKDTRLMGEDSERRKERERIYSVIDEATAMVSHKA